MLYKLLKNIFTPAYPFILFMFLFLFLFAMMTLLVGADGKHVEGGPDGNNCAA